MKEASADQLIVNKVLEGDTHAFNELVIRHQQYAFSIALGIVNNHEDAEEVAHDAFVKAFKSLKYFNRQAKFTTWLYRIVFNTAISSKRKNRIQTNPIEEQIHGNVVMDQKNTAESADRSYYLKKAMDMLSEIDRSLLTLFYLKELSLEEIGEVTGIAPSATKVKLFRARKRLATKLEELLQHEVKSLV